MILFFPLQNLLQKILLLSPLFVMMKLAWLNLAALKLSCVTKHVRIKTAERFSYRRTRNSGTHVVCVIPHWSYLDVQNWRWLQRFCQSISSSSKWLFSAIQSRQISLCLQAFNLGWELVPVVIIKFTHISRIAVKRLSQQMSVCTHLNTLHIRHLTSV